MTTGPSPELPHVAGLDVTRGLRLFAGLKAVYLEALQEFVKLYGPGLAGIDAYLEVPSPERLAQARRDVHGVGGASAALGATVVERLAHEFESSRRQPAGMAGDPAAQLTALRREIAALVESLKAQLKET